MRRLGTFSWAHFRPSPHGEGGLKYGPAHPLDHLIGSLPAWGGWIEIKPNSL